MIDISYFDSINVGLKPQLKLNRPKNLLVEKLSTDNLDLTSSQETCQNL